MTISNVQDSKALELKSLQRHIKALVSLPETEAPVVSCYLPLSQGKLQDRDKFEELVRSLRRGVLAENRQDILDALEPLEAYLEDELSVDTKGVAVFSRAGDQPFFLAFQFHVEVPSWVAADSTPNIYHLVELKDIYHRYVVMICSEEHARILEVNLGAVTTQLWAERPELRRRVGREWTKEHYQNHRRNRSQKFIKEKVEVLERLFSAGGHTHLILAGQPAITSRVRKEFPKHLVEKLIDVIPKSTAKVDKSKVDQDVVQETIGAFIEAEQEESYEAVEALVRQLRTGGLAVAGTQATYQALCRGHVDVLVIGQHYDPGLGWKCGECNYVDVTKSKPGACPECCARQFRDFDIKGAIVRMAEQLGCQVETVKKSDTLEQLGHVGCLLRYRLPEDYV